MFFVMHFELLKVLLTCLCLVFHNCLPADDDPVTPKEPVEEADPMVPQAAYNSPSEKNEQLNTEYVNLRKDVYHIKDENERLKEENEILEKELQQSRYSQSKTMQQTFCFSLV